MEKKLHSFDLDATICHTLQASIFLKYQILDVGDMQTSDTN